MANHCGENCAPGDKLGGVDGWKQHPREFAECVADTRIPTMNIKLRELFGEAAAGVN
jgi:hypothetical protein